MWKKINNVQWIVLSRSNANKCQMNSNISIIQQSTYRFGHDIKHFARKLEWLKVFFFVFHRCYFVYFIEILKGDIDIHIHMTMIRRLLGAWERKTQQVNTIVFDANFETISERLAQISNLIIKKNLIFILYYILFVVQLKFPGSNNQQNSIEKQIWFRFFLFLLKLKNK